MVDRVTSCVLVRPLTCCVLKPDSEVVVRASMVVVDRLAISPLVRPRICTTGKDAMAVLRQQPPRAGCPVPDLVLLDLNMPQMDGREVLREIRGDPALATIPVVVLTTSEAERDVAASYGLGASGFVTKPVDVDELFKLIEAVEQYWFATVRRPHRPLAK